MPTPIKGGVEVGTERMDLNTVNIIAKMQLYVSVLLIDKRKVSEHQHSVGGVEVGTKGGGGRYRHLYKTFHCNNLRA